MKSFAFLLDRLSFEPGRNQKLRRLADYFAETRDPDRGYVLAALTETLSFAHAKGAAVRNLVYQKLDRTLFDLSLDYVGDLADTLAKLWPEPAERGARENLSVAEVVTALTEATPTTVVPLLEGWLDVLDENGRWALLKLVTGALRIGVSRRLASTALAALSERSGSPRGVDEIEEVWHGLAPPYEPLFAWLEGKGERPGADARAPYRPVMLAHPLEETDLASLDASEFSAEWKWDGIRVQVVGDRGHVALYARSGEEVSASFPDIVEAVDFDAVLDGELLVISNGELQPFADLQRRLNRKKVSASMRAEFPVGVRLYDILFDGEEDLRGQTLEARRARLDAWYSRAPRPRFDLSPRITFTTWEALDRDRQANTDTGVEGVMLKRKSSLYVAGRPKGLWYKWKRAPFTVDTVLMYAQRGSGKRSSFYSDYTFGAWRGEELVPVGKAYFGFTDKELEELDKWIRNHTTNKFGPVREVERKLVLEVAFDGIQRSTRHKSGVAMRFPRIARIRWDKPAEDADRLETLEKLIPIGSTVAADVG